MSNEPQIYVACLATYNNGRLHGKWINAHQEAELIWKEINAMLALSPELDAEEWTILDYQGFGEVRIRESESIETVTALAAFIVEHGELGAEVLAHFGNNLEDATTKLLEECYHGEYDSEEGFAQSLHEECYDIPDHLAMYIDYQKIARDLFINDYMSFTVDHKVHVFNYF